MVTIYIGGIGPLPPENQPTGIFKRAHAQPVWLGGEGLTGDAQADRRVHGGVEKALHQYPSAHYARLAQAFPEAAALLVPGSIGENLNTGAWDESTVCIGDVFRFGDARIQVSQPRSPCWKIDRRYGQDGMAQFIDAQGLTGWYYRVIEAGKVAPGCVFERVDRLAGAMALADFWCAWKAHRPEAKQLERAATAPGLAANWMEKIADRIEWLRRHPQ